MSLTHDSKGEELTVSEEAFLEQPEIDIQAALDKFDEFIKYNETVRAAQLSDAPQFGKLVKYLSIFEIPSGDKEAISSASASLGLHMEESDVIHPCPKPEVRIEDEELGEYVTIGLYESRNSDLIGMIGKSHTLDSSGQQPVVGFKIRLATKENPASLENFQRLKEQETRAKRADKKFGKAATSASVQVASA